MGKRLSCQGNLRQITLGWLMYLEDHDGRFLKRTNAHINYGGWMSINPTHRKYERPLNPYLQLPLKPTSESQAEIFKCPSDRGEELGSGMPFYTTKGSSYTTNIFLIGPPQGCQLPSQELMDELNARISNVNYQSVSTPSLLSLIGDYGWNNCWQPTVPRIGDCHGKRCFHNLAYLDGHVDFVPIIKGLYVTDEYTVIPFDGLRALAREVQKEEPCE